MAICFGYQSFKINSRKDAKERKEENNIRKLNFF